MEGNIFTSQLKFHSCLNFFNFLISKSIPHQFVNTAHLITFKIQVAITKKNPCMLYFRPVGRRAIAIRSNPDLTEDAGAAPELFQHLRAALVQEWKCIRQQVSDLICNKNEEGAPSKIQGINK